MWVYLSQLTTAGGKSSACQASYHAAETKGEWEVFADVRGFEPPVLDVRLKAGGSPDTRQGEG